MDTDKTIHGGGKHAPPTRTATDEQLDSLVFIGFAARPIRGAGAMVDIRVDSGNVRLE